MLFVAAACGQKPGVADEQPAGAFGLPPGLEVNEQGELVNAEGDVVGTSGGFGGTGSVSGGGSSGTTGSASGSGGTGASSQGPSTAGGGGAAPGAGDDTGVSGTTILLGSHAPLTGAAPVPSESANRSKDIYFRWLKSQGRKINGRDVEVILKNDQYNPSSAVAVCKEMVEQDKVFMLTGAAGTDQIQACARYAASVGVPYVSAGVTERGLTGLPNYFAISMTYPDQAPLLADYLTSRLGAKGEKNGMLWFKTANFEDAHSAFLSAMKSRGAKVHYDRSVPKNAGFGTAQTVVQEMKSQGIKNVYVLTSPVFFIEVIKASNAQQFQPQWAGVGITMTFDTVAAASCASGPSLNGAKFFAPFPAWAEIDRFDPNYKKAARKFYGNEGDDFMVLGWTANMALADMLELAGRALTRERFVFFSAQAKNLKTTTGPPLSFSNSDRFGASQVHVSEARCSDRRWHNIMSFVSDF
jgi:branched-chain amino acid transport system substrate-binding protein